MVVLSHLLEGFKGEPQRDIDFSTTWVTAYDCKKEILEKLKHQAEEGVVTLRVADTVTIAECLRSP